MRPKKLEGTELCEHGMKILQASLNKEPIEVWHERTREWIIIRHTPDFDLPLWQYRLKEGPDFGDIWQTEGGRYVYITSIYGDMRVLFGDSSKLGNIGATKLDKLVAQNKTIKEYSEEFL